MSCSLAKGSLLVLALVLPAGCRWMWFENRSAAEAFTGGVVVIMGSTELVLVITTSTQN